MTTLSAPSDSTKVPEITDMAWLSWVEDIHRGVYRERSDVLRAMTHVYHQNLLTGEE